MRGSKEFEMFKEYNCSKTYETAFHMLPVTQAALANKFAETAYVTALHVSRADMALNNEDEKNLFGTTLWT